MAAWRSKIFSSRVEKIFHSFAALTGEIHSKRNFVSPRGHVISSIILNADRLVFSTPLITIMHHILFLFQPL